MEADDNFENGSENVNNPDNKNVSALEHNIKSKGEYAYYYAHGRKFEKKEETQGKVIEGPGIITGGDPILLQKTLKEVEIIKEPKKITKYLFYDDGDYVRVKFEIPDELKGVLTEDNIESNFSERTLDLKLNAQSGDPYILFIKKLFQKIKPEECKTKISKGNVCVSLKKKNEDEEWDKLAA